MLPKLKSIILYVREIDSWLNLDKVSSFLAKVDWILALDVVQNLKASANEQLHFYLVLYTNRFVEFVFDPF